MAWASQLMSEGGRDKALGRRPDPETLSVSLQFVTYHVGGNGARNFPRLVMRADC